MCIRDRGVVLASPPFGITLAQSLGAPLNQAFGWRTTFVIVGAVAVGVVALLALFVKPVEKSVPAEKTAGDVYKRQATQWWHIRQHI